MKGAGKPCATLCLHAILAAAAPPIISVSGPPFCGVPPGMCSIHLCKWHQRENTSFSSRPGHVWMTSMHPPPCPGRWTARLPPTPPRGRLRLRPHRVRILGGRGLSSPFAFSLLLTRITAYRVETGPYFVPGLPHVVAYSRRPRPREPEAALEPEPVGTPLASRATASTAARPPPPCHSRWQVGICPDWGICGARILLWAVPGTLSRPTSLRAPRQVTCDISLLNPSTLPASFWRKRVE